MIALASLFYVVALTAQTPQEVTELRALVKDGPDSALVQRLRRGPRDLREVLRQYLAEAAGRKDSVGVASLAGAERLANGWLLASGDSFFVRRVRRFRSLSPTNQQLNVTADSLVRAGNIALQSGQRDDAWTPWRESLRVYEELTDSAGMARALLAIAGGFRGAGQRDSAEAYFKRCRDLAEQFRDYTTLGNVITQQADMKQNRGDYAGVQEQLAEAKSILERAADPVGVASAINVSAIVALRQGNVAGARRAFEAALAVYRGAASDANVAMILGNLGSLALNTGDYAEATARYGEALGAYRKLGRETDAAGMLRGLGVVAMGRGDYGAALTAFSEAVEILQRTGPVRLEIDARVLVSDARSDMGDLQGAVAELDRADALARRSNAGGATLARLALARGHLAYRFNRLAEAEREYARIQGLAPSAASSEMHLRRRAQLGIAEVLVRRGSYRDAQVTMERLLQHGGEVDPHNDANARVLLGEAAWRAGDTATARRAFRQAIDTMRSIGSADDEADALAQLGDLEVNVGRAAAAESLYRQAITRLGTLPAINAWRLHAGLATALRTRGALNDAVTELQTAIAQIERASGRVRLEEHRSAFRADKWDVYIELALIERARGRTEAALDVSERLRARQMLELLARGRPATAVAGGSLVDRELDLRRKIAELTPQVEAPADQARGLRDPAAAAPANGAASDALARAQEEYSNLLLEMREANPAYAALVRAETAPPSAIRAALAPDEALLEYLVGDSTTVVFVVTRDSLAAFDLQMSQATLAGLVDFARRTLAAPAAGAAPRDWRPSLRRLYRRLVAPVEASRLLAGRRRLVIVPHAELHYLPWSALVVPGSPERLLIDRYVIEYVPSASVWLRLRERPAPPKDGGVLALAPRAAALPGSEAEVAAIQRTFGARARTLVGAPATERAFRTLAPGQEIIHLATFGVLNKHNPLFSFVELGAEGDEDGRLEVHEVFGLRLNARLLVLSACQTGVGAGAFTDVPPGDDWVGLVQGFLYAGASNVMATLWPVSDVATARLMDGMYKELAAGRPEAEALALAQRAALRQPGTAHPFYWAGFTLVRGR